MLFKLKFLKELPLYATVQPYRLHGFPDLPDDQQTNCHYEHVEEVPAIDLRDAAHASRFEDEGFEFVNRPPRSPLRAAIFEDNTTASDQAVREYVQDTMDMVRKRLRPDSVVAIDWRFRRNDDNAFPQRLEGGDVRKQAIAVATTAHCDFSYDGGFDRLQLHLSADEMSAVEDGRMHAMIVNVWRPLRTVTSAPLVLADRRTIAKADLTEADQVMTNKVNKTAYVYYRPSQKWYWMSNLCPDEAVIFATWKPETDSKFADYSPHVAAYLHGLDGSAPPRESVEVRMITLFNTSRGQNAKSEEVAT